MGVSLYIWQNMWSLCSRTWNQAISTFSSNYFHQLTEKCRQHSKFSTSRRRPFAMSKLSPTLESTCIWRTFTRSADPVSILTSTARPIRFGVFTLPWVTLYMMSSTHDTTRLSVASDISTYKFEMGRSDWKPTKLVYRHQWSISKMKWENTNLTHPI
jgi:hypothetical protein